MKRLSIIAALCLTSACSQEAAPAEPAATPPTPEPVVAAEPAAPVVPTPEPEPTAEELPIEADFEAEVTAQITSKNFKTELKRLETEIANDSAE